MPGVLEEDGGDVAARRTLILRSRASSRGVSKDGTAHRSILRDTRKSALLRMRGAPYSTLPIFFTAAISRALSAATNFANSGASR